MKDAIKDSGLSTTEINDIILYVIQPESQQSKILSKKNSEKKKATVNPDEAVALGAAIQ